MIVIVIAAQVFINIRAVHISCSGEIMIDHDYSPGFGVVSKDKPFVARPVGASYVAGRRLQRKIFYGSYLDIILGKRCHAP